MASAGYLTSIVQPFTRVFTAHSIAPLLQPGDDFKGIPDEAGPARNARGFALFVA